MTIGERIRTARKRAGLTQAQLSEKSGVAAISIHQYEAGKRKPRLEQLIRISSALNIDMIDLTGLESEMTEYRIVLTEAGGLSDSKSYNVREIYNLLSDNEKAEFWDRLMEPLHTQLNEAFDRLNANGQQEALKRVRELTEIPRYRRQDAPVPYSDGTAPEDE